MRPRPDPVGPGQESVWDYPRPPRLEPSTRHLRVELDGRVLAETRRSMRVLETSHPPVYYMPPDDVDRALVLPEDAGRDSVCEWKGTARYWDAVVGSRRVARVAWSYPQPEDRFAPIAGWLAFYPGRVDGAWVDGTPVTPQPGEFYGGWITPDVVGPFKGGPGSWGW